jgi:hypothetical protein
VAFGVRPLHYACGELVTKLARRYGDILTEVVELGGGDLDPLHRVSARHHGCGARRAPRRAMRRLDVHVAAIKVKECLVSTDEFSPISSGAYWSSSNLSARLPPTTAPRPSGRGRSGRVIAIRSAEASSFR